MISARVKSWLRPNFAGYGLVEKIVLGDAFPESTVDTAISLEWTSLNLSSIFSISTFHFYLLLSPSLVSEVGDVSRG